MIVDDNRDDFLILTRMIKPEYRTLYHDGQKNALGTIIYQNPKCILLDYNLGLFSGINLLKEIKSTEAISDISVIMLTNEKTPDAIIDCMKNGADDYIIKDDFNKELILQTIRSSVEKVNLQKIIKTYEQNNQLLEAIPSIQISIDENDRVVRWNAVAENTFGLTQEDTTGKVFKNCKIQWDWETISEKIRRCRQNEQTVRLDDMKFLRPDGTDGFIGMTIYPVEKNSSNPKPANVLVMGMDVTERKIRESQLSQAQKLESIGQLASGIAHEINTPTQYIGDNTQFLKKSFTHILVLLEIYHQLLEQAKQGKISPELISHLEETIEKCKLTYLIEEIPEAIQEALDGIDRVSQIVRAMKEFAHPGTEEKTALDINHAIESTITVARNEWKYVADMNTEFDPDLPLVHCLPGDFNQVILNMIVNAAHAISDVTDEDDDKGAITISTQVEGDCVEIRISDTGSGIPKNALAKIFDPFFTTKEVGRGSGQGLAIAHNVIANKHGGSIDCETEVGKGTTFIIKLPLKSIAAEKEPEPTHV